MATRERYDLLINHGGARIIEKREKEDRKKTGPAWYYYLGFVGSIGFTIAVPIAGGALIGGYIDRVWLSYPRATLSFLLLGVILSFISFFKIIRDVLSEH